MKKAIVKTDIASLYQEASSTSELADETLHGMVLEPIGEAENGFLPVRTHYLYEGYVSQDCIIMMTGDEAESWHATAMHVVTAPYADVMAEPKVQANRLAGLPRGSLVCVQGAAENGWAPVLLAGGEKAFMRMSHLAVKAPHWQQVTEKELRSALVHAALQYQGTSYRWGGKTPLGIDCSGLVSMAYMLCGCLIYRDAGIEPGFPIKEIPGEAIKEGDLLFFPGHVAMYIGDGRYIHSTGFAGSDGVVINSLIDGEPDYRADLAGKITQAGSIF